MKKSGLRFFATFCVFAVWMINGAARTPGQAASGPQNLLYVPLLIQGGAAFTPARQVNFDFSPYMDGQDPNTGIVLSEKQIRQRLSLIAPYSTWVRSFGCGSGLEAIGQIGREMKLKVAAGAWIGRDLAANQKQIDCLIAEANAGNADLLIVGSEALLRGDVPVETLIQYLDQVRAAVPAGVQVSTADVYSVLLANPGLIDHVDVVMANIYPFWEGYPIEHAVAIVNDRYQQLVTTFGPKPVYISETGWPSCGSFHDSVGSPANEAAFFNQIVSWARDRKVKLFYFSALDESWKARTEGPQGACWGVFDSRGRLKPGMETAFMNVSTPYSTELPLTCGTSTFSFQYTSVPAMGSMENVKGRTCGIANLQYNIVLYINVGGSWWVKPYQNNPYTPIAPDGSWEVDYTTGGIDEQAAILRAYLLPKGVDAFGDLSTYPYIDAVR